MKQSSSNNIRKPHLLKVPSPLGSSFIIKGDEIAWNNPWHFHPEIELLYCIKGKGTNYIGQYIESIEEGELLLFGKNLPHTRQRSKAYYEQNAAEQPETIVLQFNEEFLGEMFFKLRECVHIETLLRKAERGLKFYGTTRDSVCDILKSMQGKQGITAILQIVSILDILATSDEYSMLNSIHYLSDVNNIDSRKINKVYHYTQTYFKQPISLSDVAAVINLTEAAFCRYFKARTRKNYFQYLSEVRIAHACAMLTEQDIDVAEVCFSSGFNNLSNFHKQFKKIMKDTPKEYREKGRYRIPQAIHRLIDKG